MSGGLRRSPEQLPPKGTLPPAAGEVARGATVGAVVANVAALLAPLPDARREARLVVAAGLGVEPAQIMGFPERPVSTEERDRVLALARRRAAGEPASRLLGRREFWSLSFALSPETLDPRADSETLVEAALALVPDRAAPLRVLDLGTGTGCLLVALLSELPRASGVGIDRSSGAAMTARRNAAALGLGRRAHFIAGDWGAALAGCFDLVVANPPYIPSGAIAGLAPEVARHDPLLALDGGGDGLAAYRALAAELPRLLVEGAHAALEFGEGQGPQIAALMERAGLSVLGTRSDLAGIERCLVLRQKTVGMHPATV